MIMASALVKAGIHVTSDASAAEPEPRSGRQEDARGLPRRLRPRGRSPAERAGPVSSPAGTISRRDRPPRTLRRNAPRVTRRASRDKAASALISPGRSRRISSSRTPALPSVAALHAAREPRASRRATKSSRTPSSRRTARPASSRAVPDGTENSVSSSSVRGVRPPRTASRPVIATSTVGTRRRRARERRTDRAPGPREAAACLCPPPPSAVTMPRSADGPPRRRYSVTGGQCSSDGRLVAGQPATNPPRAATNGSNWRSASAPDLPHLPSR